MPSEFTRRPGSGFFLMLAKFFIKTLASQTARFRPGEFFYYFVRQAESFVQAKCLLARNIFVFFQFLNPARERFGKFLALRPVCIYYVVPPMLQFGIKDRKSTRLTSSHGSIS